QQWKKVMKLAVVDLNFLICKGNRKDLWATLIENKILENQQEQKQQQLLFNYAPTSSLCYQRKVTKADLNKVSEIYGKLRQKWTLQSGRLVEDVVYETCKSFCVEHPAHSFIFDIDDYLWEDVFESEELDEIKTEAKENLNQPFPPELQDIVMKLHRKKTAIEMYNAICEVEAHPFKDVAKFWLKQSITDYILLFVEDKHLSPFETEQDLLDDVYGFIKKSCKISSTKAYSAKQSKATSEAVNSNRSICNTRVPSRQRCADNADLSFEYNGNELFCVEIGLRDKGPNGTKEMNERDLKLPKMMKNFCCRLTNNLKVDPKHIKITGIIISGMNITARIMSFKNGSISLLSRSSRLRMPTSVQEIPHFLPPVLNLIYNINQTIKSTIEAIDDASSSVV
ncbi:hypothetical protein CU098_001614, partial [Rhizopus stolonifer]